jgi:hypothetical protein
VTTGLWLHLWQEFPKQVALHVDPVLSSNTLDRDTDFEALFGQTLRFRSVLTTVLGLLSDDQPVLTGADLSSSLEPNAAADVAVDGACAPGSREDRDPATFGREFRATSRLSWARPFVELAQRGVAQSAELREAR